MRIKPSTNHEEVEVVALRQLLPAKQALEAWHTIWTSERFRRPTLRSATGVSRREIHHQN
jgi:hypothetical protein